MDVETSSSTAQAVRGRLVRVPRQLERRRQELLLLLLLLRLLLPGASGQSKPPERACDTSTIRALVDLLSMDLAQVVQRAPKAHYDDRRMTVSPGLAIRWPGKRTASTFR